VPGLISVPVAKGHLASKMYYTKAMDWFRDKYNSETVEVLFVLATDDPNWSLRMFGDVSDVVLTSKAKTTFSMFQPMFDLAVMVQCDHSIIRYNTTLY